MIATAWVCESCEVGGTDVEPKPPCWNCGGPTVVTARPPVSELRMRTEPFWADRVLPW